jgi:hypothetical protein
MKMLTQEACQGPVRDAFKANGAALQGLTAEGLRPVVLKDFQVGDAGVGPVANASREPGEGAAPVLLASKLVPVCSCSVCLCYVVNNTAGLLHGLPLRYFMLQIATRAQKASVEPAEIERYEQYNLKHGAKLAGKEEEEMQEDDW